MAIKHSELTRLLMDFEHKTPKQLPEFIEQCVDATRNGVWPEAWDGKTPMTPPPAVSVPAKSGFKFSSISEKELLGVKPELVKVVRRALELSTQDFMVFDGIRTEAEQRRHVQNGTSKTMASKHLDGLAVDLVPWINGKPTWDWIGCYKVAWAMDQAATEQGVANRITWGGAWDRTLADFGNNQQDYEAQVQAYRTRHPGPDFIDGPHFEWRV